VRRSPIRFIGACLLLLVLAWLVYMVGLLVADAIAIIVLLVALSLNQRA
jgi:hypothetical protein